jgi:hypothetical protein
MVKFDKDWRYERLCYFKFSNFAASSPPVVPQAVLSLPVGIHTLLYEVAMI